MQRSDRALIVVAILMLLLTLGVFNNFDRFFNRGAGNRQNVIAEIVSGDGDARVKYKNDFHWQKARTKDGLIFDDSVFAGPNAHVEMKIGESKLSLEPNTLIVLRKDDLFKTLKFDYGTLKGVLARNDKIYVESEGQRLELSSQSNAKVTITKQNGNTTIQVKSGSAKVMRAGKTQVVTAEKPMVVEAPVRRARPLQWVSPKQNIFYTRGGSLAVEFKWRYGGRQNIGVDDAFTLELSPDPDFAKLAGQETKLGEDHASFKFTPNTSLYARVSNGYGDTTSVRQITVRALNSPSIALPQAEAELPAPAVAQPANVFVKIADVPVGAKAWTQVARDAEFKDLVVNKSMTVAELSAQLAPGEYHVRARNLIENDNIQRENMQRDDHQRDNIEGVQSEWSKPVHFYVNQSLDLEHLVQHVLPARLFIANRNYPPALYFADDAKVQEFLAPVEPLPKYFAPVQRQGFHLVISRPGNDASAREALTPQFPSDWLYPGEVDIRYRLESRRGDKTNIVYDNTHRVQVELEAPNHLRATPNGRLTWSPVLFARGYEGQLRSPNGTITTFASHEPKATLALAEAGATYAYRVRAIGRAHEPITGWSALQTLRTPTPPPLPPPAAEPERVDIPIAEEPPPPPPPARVPAQASLALKIDQPGDASWLHKIKSWIWAGVGYNIIDVRQTLASTADIRYQNNDGPSLNLEAGFLNLGGVGAIVSYTRLPGEIKIDNHAIDHSDFVWDQYSAEVLARLGWHPRLLSRELTLALRAGAQYHQFPFLYVNNSQAVLQGRNNMTTASLGFMAETSGRLKYHWNMRLQQPLHTSSEGGNNFSVSPIIAFDGSVGTSYLLTETWKTGLFWYGQFHDYKFKYSANNQTNDGAQSLFYSALELRLGYDF